MKRVLAGGGKWAAGVAVLLALTAPGASAGVQHLAQTVYSGRTTWYPSDTGPDACTGKNHRDSDFYVALNVRQFGDGSRACGRQLRVDYSGKSITVTVVDECATCAGSGQLDLTRGAFEVLAGNADVGAIYTTWSFTDEGDDPPPARR
ncbi:RlpA-like double-psi beta-barrel domain-containing protein [Amycolatopsis rhabdoformis]|uniref:RlpA-like double-psi beta-barrel domain-containing protein n=1 Tax=Amycolatopsis rhabdoformis TaxID=1448059 RepID=A0ABZ1I172_9PSEU|nr:RlpA-like double-psi beta-barrel domain-containing protein [Amycolatopsis rhabdoformis]WSE28152.1 RlpA-like double-psi beta-barrel domain-containing protein [Amycolatopsis rhabdoformis]